ncbi:MAG: sugar phosphate isomerase/epimerase, partial [Spirochaetaceae bacterium]|nr:sugar phosphate isomerase/epimerase [Spirochaetaceae bacterium]
MMGFGASPAFYISASGPGFNVTDIAAAIPRAAALGLTALQLEVYRPEAVKEWTASAVAEITSRLDGEGLEPSQWVAHFALSDFTSLATLSRPRHDAGFAAFLDIAAAFPSCEVLTLPIPEFDPVGVLSAARLAGARAALVELIGRRLEAAAAAGKRLALEILPGSLVGGTEGFLRLREEAGLETLAYNFDVGHAWARKERVELIPAALGEALAGTHLCDNFGKENRKRRPGAGSVDWESLVSALVAAGYEGSLDLEIICEPEAVDREYREGKEALAAAG